MQNDTIEPFDDYFPRDGLKQSYVKNKILSGTPISEIKYEVP